MSETDTQTEESEDSTVVNPDGNPDERTAPPSNPDVDTDRLEHEEEDADRTLPS